MEEDIKNMSKEELLEYLEDISQQLDNIALDQIQFAISELQFFKEEYKKLEKEVLHWKGQYHLLSRKIDVIPTSVIQEKIKELDKEKLKYDNDLRIYTLRNTFDFQKEVLQEILKEGRR